MTATQHDHPDRSELNAFGLGLLNPQRSAAAEKHVAGCESCCDAVQKAPDDTLVHQLREAATLPALPAPAASTPPDQETINHPASADAPFEPPDDLARHPRYRLLKLLGAGGMGAVYQAEHGVMRRLVALKVINREYTSNRAAAERFQREIRAAAQLHHPNIVAAYDAEQAGETHFLVMEYIDGVNLAQLVAEKGLLPVAEACEYVRQAALGLHHAHERGMVHRDVKPHNLIRSADGVVKLLDFGLASVVECGEGQLTGTNAIMGTPDYIAPEQAENTHAADARSDIYSLGCTLYHLLTGRPPFTYPSTLLKLVAHREEAPAPVRAVRPDVPEELAAVLSRMMAKAPVDRYQTAAEVAAALAPFADATALPRPRPKSRRRLWVAAAVAAVCMAGLAAAVAAVVVHIQTDQGEVTIQTDDPNIEVVVTKGGKMVRIFDPQSKQTWQLDPEKFELSMAEQPDGLNIALDGKTPFILKRKDGKLLVTVTRGPATAPAEITNSIGMKLKLIKPGTFTMGSPKEEEGREDIEGPQHEVEITKAFYMGAYPVTKGQFAAFVKDDGYQTDAEKDGKPFYAFDLATAKWVQKPYTWRNPGFPQGDDHPVVGVSWNDATAFCAWLSRKDGKTYELPTEAEWEYACRAGTKTRFWCGDTDASLQGNANIADASLKEKSPGATWAVAWDDGFAFTSPVGAFKANPWGLYDMHGNVWQWCADGYDKYQEGSIKDPKDKERSNLRVLRGGSWLDGPRSCRSAYRFDYDPAPRLDLDGFRVALRLPASQRPQQVGDLSGAVPLVAAAPADITNSIGMKLKLIKPGTFTMGSPKEEDGRNDNEGPQHEVEITRAFYMGAYPVTKGQFAAFAKGAPYTTETDGKGFGYNASTKTFEHTGKYSWLDLGFAQADDHPVVEVTWNDAKAFCDWLSKKEGKSYELPTEAEWEYACRAGTTTRFWCGDTDASLKGNANIADASFKEKYPDASWAVAWNDGYPFASPVGSFNKNPWGLYDMHGNVWQWCADGDDQYQEGSIKDPKGKDSANSRALRGGSWNDEPRLCRSAHRGNGAPADRGAHSGFRVVLRLPARTP